MKTFDYQRANSVDDAIKIATLTEGDLAEAQRPFFISRCRKTTDFRRWI